MFKYRKTLKEVSYIEKLITSILNDEENSGYRVEINYGNGKLFEDKNNEYDIDIYIIENYSKYNDKGKTMRIMNNKSYIRDYRLPCRIVGEPIKSKGVIKDIEFDKVNILKKLKENKKYITNERLRTIEVPSKNYQNKSEKANHNRITVEQIYPANITVYFEE
ncbi:hypothetical protein QI339_12220 [Staphylococcus saprophyticus]|nr:hypothetical protein [Staphylococcus saprophyticus]